MTYPVGDIVTIVLCNQCQCCLIQEEDEHHCLTCHLEIQLEDICGCGACIDKAQAWAENGWPWIRGQH
jgi:hypothetical protein